MSKVVREDVDNLNAVLTVTVEKSDFAPKYKAELQKYRKQSNMKGFRKGQTPISMIKKMYGKQVLSNVVGETFSKTLDEYMTENNINILGQPLPSKDQELLDFDLKNVGDYTLNFDLGLEPEFEIKGAGASDSYMHYVVEIPEEDVDKELDNARKQLGERVHPTDNIKEDDIIVLAALELDADGKEVKDDGVEAEFSLLVNTIIDEEVKQDILSKKTGDIVRFNVYKLEKGDDEDAHRKYVNKHLLKLGDDHEGEVGELFEARIDDVNRIEPAAMEQEFFDKYFGKDEVSSELEARTEVKKNIAKAYNNQADALLFRDIQKRILEETEMEFPKGFLLRWMQENNQNATLESLENQWEDTAKGLKWTLVKNKISEAKDLKISEEDIKRELTNMVISQYGAQMAQYAPMFVEQMMKDEGQVNRAIDRASDNLVFKSIKEEVTLQDNEVTIEELNKVMEDIQAEIAVEREAKAKALAANSDEEE